MRHIGSFVVFIIGLSILMVCFHQIGYLEGYKDGQIAALTGRGRIPLGYQFRFNENLGTNSQQLINGEYMAKKSAVRKTARESNTTQKITDPIIYDTQLALFKFNARLAALECVAGQLTRDVSDLKCGQEASKSSVSKAFNLKKAMDVDQGSVYYEIDATLGPARIIDTNFYTPKIKTPRIVVKYYTENNGHYLVVVNQDGTYEGKQVLFNI